MNSNEAQLICNRLDLGSLLKTPQPVAGGLLHSMWKIETTKGIFACKQLSKNIDLTDKIRAEYELSENIAMQFHMQGIPALYALKATTKYLIDNGDNTYLIYPWHTGKVLPTHVKNKEYALKIAHVLACMHSCTILTQNTNPNPPSAHAPQKIEDLVTRAVQKAMPYAQDLQHNLGLLTSIATDYNVFLNNHNWALNISHRDLDQKNVLWDEYHNPTIIDWESAGYINPTQEIIDVALNWSNVLHTFDEDLFRSILIAYIKQGGLLNINDVPVAFNAILNNWLNWLIFNVECHLDDPLEKYSKQVNITLKLIVKLNSLMPKLSKEINIMFKLH